MTWLVITLGGAADGAKLPKGGGRCAPLRRLLALLCSAALVRGAWPRLGAPIVSLASARPPSQPLLAAWQCNAQDGSIAQDGVTVDASLPCNWGLSAEAAATPSASCSGAELLAAIGGKGSDDLPKYAKELTLKQGALRAKELADSGAFFRAPPAVPYFAHGAQFAAAHAARRSTPKETCQWILQLVEARREYPTSPTAGSDIVSEPSVTAKAGPAWVLGCLVHLFRRLDTGHRASRDNGRLHGCKPCGARGMCGLSVCPPLALALHTLRLHTSAWCNSFGYLSAVFGTHTHLDMCSIAPTRTPMLYPSWAPP